MADASFSFQQFLFISEFQKLQIILLLKRPFMHRGNFLSRFPRLTRVINKMEYI